MPLPIYMDVHVPAAITEGLQRRGINVLTSQADVTDRLPDDQLLRHTTQRGRVLFSQDEDLLRIASDWQRQGIAFAGVIYAHQLSGGIGELARDLELVLTCCTAEELANRVTYLPLN